MPTTDTNEISVFKGELTKKELVKQSKRILEAFPKFPKQQLEILKDRFAANNFSDERMIASIDHVIDTYEGWDKTPNIANFIQFGKETKVYNYIESIEYGQDKLEIVDLGLGSPRWVLPEIKEKYDLPHWGPLEVYKAY